VLKAMREARFDTMGVSRSYLDFYLGFAIRCRSRSWCWAYCSGSTRNGRDSTLRPRTCGPMLASLKWLRRTWR